jgi:hypothetical protein
LKCTAAGTHIHICEWRHLTNPRSAPHSPGGFWKKNTVPSSLSTLTALKGVDLANNRLSGLVPPLPFGQYTIHCCLEDASRNRFACPLPAGADLCTCFGRKITCTWYELDTRSDFVPFDIFDICEFVPFDAFTYQKNPNQTFFFFFAELRMHFLL